MRLGGHHHWILTLITFLVPATVIFGLLIYIAVTWSVLWTLLALAILGALGHDLGADCAEVDGAREARDVGG